MKFYGNTDNGQLNIFNWEQAQSWAQSHPNRKIEVDVKLYSEKRSREQNRYLHMLFTIFSEEMIKKTNNQKYTQDIMKELCKGKFLMVSDIDEDTGKLIGQRVKNTSELSKPEMVAFIDNIIMWAADVFHIELPYPNEQFKTEI